MSLSAGDKAIVREIVFEVFESVVPRFRDMIEMHATKCAGAKVGRVAFGLTAAVGGLIGSVLTAVVIAIVMRHL